MGKEIKKDLEELKINEHDFRDQNLQRKKIMNNILKKNRMKTGWKWSEEIKLAHSQNMNGILEKPKAQKKN